MQTLISIKSKFNKMGSIIQFDGKINIWRLATNHSFKLENSRGKFNSNKKIPNKPRH
jgi:hypothetical protein